MVGVTPGLSSENGGTSARKTSPACVRIQPAAPGRLIDSNQADIDKYRYAEYVSALIWSFSPNHPSG